MATSTVTVPVVRGCGVRKKGGVYAEVPTSPFGQPIENFLIDSPIVVDKAALGLSEIGVKLIEKAGVYHVFDIVGQEHYPNVADFVEEARRFGVSRRLPTTLDYSLITPQSRLILLHARAFIYNSAEYYQAEDAALWTCPKNKVEHGHKTMLTEPPPMCAGLWWNDIEGGAPHTVNTEQPRDLAELRAMGDKNLVKRTCPSFAYNGHSRPATVKPILQPGPVRKFPAPAYCRSQRSG